MDIGKKYKNNQDHLSFHCIDKMTESNRKYDLLYINTVLQYVDDYKDCFDELLNHDFRYIVLNRLIAGKIPTFVTSQLFGNKKSPCVFLNIDELISFLKTKMYDLIFISKCDEFYDYYYDKNIPDNYRIPFDVNLIFEKKY